MLREFVSLTLLLLYSDASTSVSGVSPTASTPQLNASSSLTRVIGLMGSGKQYCDPMLNTNSILNNIKVPNPSNSVLVWNCPVPLNVPGAVAGCVNQLAAHLHAALLTTTQCKVMNRQMCVFDPSSQLAVDLKAPLLNSQLNRMEALERTLWNNINGVASSIPGLPANFQPNPPTPQSGAIASPYTGMPYPGTSAAAGLVANTPCTAYVSDASPIATLANLLLKNAFDNCVVDVQLAQRLVELFDALETANRQCLAMLPPPPLPQMSYSNLGQASLNDPSMLFAPPPGYLYQPPPQVPPPTQ